MDELIKALRYCSEHDGCDYYIAKDCPRENTWVCGADCEQILMRDAADAIERLTDEIDRKDKALQAWVTTLESACERDQRGVL